MEICGKLPSPAVTNKKVSAPPTATISRPTTTTKQNPTTSAKPQLKVPPSSNVCDAQNTSPTAVLETASTVHNEPMKPSKTTVNKSPTRTPSKPPPLKETTKQNSSAPPSPPAPKVHLEPTKPSPLEAAKYAASTISPTTTVVTKRKSRATKGRTKATYDVCYKRYKHNTLKFAGNLKTSGKPPLDEAKKSTTSTPTTPTDIPIKHASTNLTKVNKTPPPKPPNDSNLNIKPASKPTSVARQNLQTKEKDTPLGTDGEVLIKVEKDVPKKRKAGNLKTCRTNRRMRRSVDIDTPNREMDDGYLPFGSIVSINGYELHSSTWRSREEAPTIYGIVENPGRFDTEDAQTISEEENFVTFVVSEQMEWIDTREMNVRREKVLRADLTLECFPPDKTTNEDEVQVVQPFTKWFETTRRFNKFVWQIKTLQNPCLGCGSEWCLYHKDPEAMNKIMDTLLQDNKLNCKQKRFIAYQQAIKKTYKRRLSRGVRKRVGYCFESMVKHTFPTEGETYTGFRPSESDFVETSSSSDDVSVIDLSK